MTTSTLPHALVKNKRSSGHLEPVGWCPDRAAPWWEKQSAVSQEEEPEALLGTRNFGRNHSQTEVFFCLDNVPRVLMHANTIARSPGANDHQDLKTTKF